MPVPAGMESSIVVVVVVSLSAPRALLLPSIGPRILWVPASHDSYLVRIDFGDGKTIEIGPLLLSAGASDLGRTGVVML